MKILILSDANSIHTKRWVKSLSGKGIEIVLYSITVPSDDFYEKNGIRSHVYHLFDYKKKKGAAASIKRNLRHFQAAADLKRVLKQEKPDILHAHYATSYGLVAALSGFHPFIISVWGSDIYDFPRTSRMNLLSVKYILKKADLILSTSHVMAEETRKYTEKDVTVTPFGVETDKFRKSGSGRERPFPVFGVVKTLSENYGIDDTIKAFHFFRSRHPEYSSFLKIVGDGPDRQKLTDLAGSLGLSDSVEFTGYVPHDDLPAVFEKIDVGVFLSHQESFGVSVVEAMSFGCPVVASDADGFREVMEDGRTGIIVPRRDPEQAADAMYRIVSDAALYRQMSENASVRVRNLYDWNENVSRMISVYKEFI